MQRWILTGVLICLAGCGKTEPSANGKTCSQWLEVVKNGQVKDRQNAIKGLAEIGIKDSRAVPGIVDALKDKDAEVRVDAARSLGRLGSKASAGVPNLVACLADPSLEVRNEAAVALGEMDTSDPDAIKGLIECLKDMDVRRSAVNSLGRIGPPAKEAVQSIKDSANLNGDAEFRKDAMEAVRKIELKLN